MKGYFKPINPKKYKGDPNNIIYRSSWELKLASYLDAHPDIEWWASEEIAIPYFDPTQRKRRRYFPDFIAKNKKGDVIMIEVKPHKETMVPKKPKKQTKRYLREVLTYGTNQAKWKAANEYCKDKGWKFIIMTEHELGIK